jgi:hypothetical protein
MSLGAKLAQSVSCSIVLIQFKFSTGFPRLAYVREILHLVITRTYTKFI